MLRVGPVGEVAQLEFQVLAGRAGNEFHLHLVLVAARNDEQPSRPPLSQDSLYKFTKCGQRFLAGGAKVAGRCLVPPDFRRELNKEVVDFRRGGEIEPEFEFLLTGGSKPHESGQKQSGQPTDHHAIVE